MIGQSQVTEPLMTALRSDRVNHAYLFSGPRGCGKTTSARILARCLNCAQGPTDTPCGTCPSCIELARGGSGSLDVVEIDAASHNGVDDARDLRERAVFAPARDRYKIFILDEAHMVTPQGFNALLKLVEEPPEHVKFIFATTEPDKVLGTIRSRTHHYPFRLVPPAPMLEYVQKLCEEEGVLADAGVLPLVVRAGGGSPRDTLSLLDQLMAGSDTESLSYERAVALLGYTHAALLDEVIDAIAASDAAAAFAAVDRVIQTGQDPRRFVEDLLERARDLIVIAAAPDQAAAVLRGIPADDLVRLTAQAKRVGGPELSRIADVVNAALTEMTGATSPRLHLELMIARVLVPRVGAGRTDVSVSPTATPAVAAPAAPVTTTVQAVPPTAQIPAAAHAPARTPVPAAPPAAPVSPAAAPAVTAPATATPARATPPAAPVTSMPAGPLTLSQVQSAWQEVLGLLEKRDRNAWIAVFSAQVAEYRDDDVLVLEFPSAVEVTQFRAGAPGKTPSDVLRTAIVDTLGARVKYIARVIDAPASPPAETRSAPAPAPASRPAQPPAAPPAASRAPAPPAPRTDAAPPAAPKSPAPPPPVARVATWETVQIPSDEPPPLDDADAPAEWEPEYEASEPVEPLATHTRDGAERYGEAVVREVLNATFIEEVQLAIPDAPRRIGEE